MTEYENIKRIILLIEDDPEQRANLEKTARRYFDINEGNSVCVAENPKKAVGELKNYLQHSPEARLHAVLDYNMGLNPPGDKKPTEMLFYDKNFHHYLENGGIVIMYSGYIEQVKQASEIFNAPRKHKNLALLIAEKSRVSTEDIFRILKSDKIPQLRLAADRYNFDLGKIIEVLRGGE